MAKSNQPVARKPRRCYKKSCENHNHQHPTQLLIFTKHKQSTASHLAVANGIPSRPIDLFQFMFLACPISAKSSNDCYTLIYINLVKSSLKSKLFHCDTKPMLFYTCASIFTGSSNYMYWHERNLFVADPKETHSVRWRFSLTGHRDCPVS